MRVKPCFECYKSSLKLEVFNFTALCPQYNPLKGHCPSGLSAGLTAARWLIDRLKRLIPHVRAVTLPEQYSCHLGCKTEAYISSPDRAACGHMHLPLWRAEMHSRAKINDLENNIGRSNKCLWWDSRSHAALAHSWSADGSQWQAMDGTGCKVGFQQLSMVATCTSKTQSVQHTAPCIHGSASPFAKTISYNRVSLSGATVHVQPGHYQANVV